MAFASSLQKGQIPVGCEICQGKNKIEFKCLDCNILMCSGCKDRVHLKIAKDHQITDIKEIGKRVTFSEIKCEHHTGQACCLFCQTCKTFICVKCVAKVHNGHQLIEEEDYNEGKVEMKPKQKGKIKFEISKEYTTDLTDIQVIEVCADGSMWMGDNIRSKLQHVKLRENRTEVITSLNTEIWGIAKTHSNNILFIQEHGTKLKLINPKTGQMTDSRYDVKPLLPVSIHVTSDHRVIIGAYSGGNPFPASGRRVVVVMDQEGKQLKEYEHDKQNKPLFTFPRCVTTTSNGNICAVDLLDKDYRCRVVVLSPGGDILGTYNGHPDVSTGDNPFKPFGILTTPSDNIVVTDLNNHLLHILTDQGQSITYYNLHDMGILYPYSLVLSKTETIYIGCVSKNGSPDTTKAKLYELEYSGI
ncbi:uncharacterized protein LOC143057765 [Mytilus galloprovincialis]|uniref:uncharacterized protein LOC143057765 n=1 Tax=Mytilus galloprovincialis TaxID=29158 RepID=UPI003F7C3A13